MQKHDTVKRICWSQVHFGAGSFMCGEGLSVTFGGLGPSSSLVLAPVLQIPRKNKYRLYVFI